MARSDRVQVTVSPAMHCALAMLAERNTITVSAQATLSLRQALAQTMKHPECQERLRRHTAHRSHATWMTDTTADRAVELIYEKANSGATEDTVQMEGAS